MTKLLLLWCWLLAHAVNQSRGNLWALKERPSHWIQSGDGELNLEVRDRIMKLMPPVVSSRVHCQRFDPSEFVFGFPA